MSFVFVWFQVYYSCGEQNLIIWWNHFSSLNQSTNSTFWYFLTWSCLLSFFQCIASVFHRLMKKKVARLQWLTSKPSHPDFDPEMSGWCTRRTLFSNHPPNWVILFPPQCFVDGGLQFSHAVLPFSSFQCPVCSSTTAPSSN